MQAGISRNGTSTFCGGNVWHYHTTLLRARTLQKTFIVHNELANYRASAPCSIVGTKKSFVCSWTWTVSDQIREQYLQTIALMTVAMRFKVRKVLSCSNTRIVGSILVWKRRNTVLFRWWKNIVIVDTQCCPNTKLWFILKIPCYYLIWILRIYITHIY
jgi:hypothetical protein